MFYHIFYINCKETINTKNTFFQSSLNITYFKPNLSHTLLNLLLNNLHMLDISIKVNVFIQKNINHIHNYVPKSIENCLFLFILSFVLDIASLFLNLSENLLINRANSNLNADQSDFPANQTVRVV